MLFNLFGKKDGGEKKVVFSDTTYISMAAKMRACLALAKEKPEVIFIAWFSDTAERFKEFFAQNGVDAGRVREYRTVTGLQLQQSVPVFIEHYPLQEKEREITAQWPVKQVTVYNALEEPFLKFFGGDKIISLMQKLGMKEDEAIMHNLITQSIGNAQKKIAKKVAFELPARSQAEWIEKNLG